MSKTIKRNKNSISKLCKGLSFEDCELTILRQSVDKIEKQIGKSTLKSPTIQNIIKIVEDFIRSKKLICYGGTAINNILPEEDQFYNKDVELPDYDFFSHNAMEDAKQLADIYFKAGFDEVEAKAGMHYGTYKVFVNFIPVADITYLDKKLFNELNRDAIKINGIRYCPPNYLRMSMYLELSRPKGDVSRWEKVLKRLTLLNKHYPLVGKNCDTIQIQRDFENKTMTEDKIKNVFYVIRDSCIDQGLVFFGAYSNRLYMNYLPKGKRHNLLHIPDFDVLSENPKVSATIIKERLQDKGYNDIRIVRKEGIGEVIAPHYEVVMGNDTLIFIYEPLACHSYNVIKIQKKQAKIATIDTILSFYLAFLYANRPYYDVDRILCMCEYLFYIQEKNRLNQKGLLKRFTMTCYGKQSTIESIREEKSKMYKKLSNKKGTKLYDLWFLKYNPREKTKKSDSKAKTKKTKIATKKDRKRVDKTKYTRKRGIVDAIQSTLSDIF